MERPAAAAGGGGGASSAAAAPDAGAAAATQARGGAASQALEPPGVGERLEVLWDIHDDSTGTVKHAWWRCVVEASDGAKGAATLLYESRGAEFPEERCAVHFLPSGELYDDGTQTTLPWRRQGEAYVLCATMRASDAPQTAGQMLDEQAQADAQAGISLEAAGSEAMQSLPYAKQAQIAEDYRQFTDFLKHKLAAILAERGEGAVVTGDDIEAAKAQFAELRAGGGGAL